MKKRTQELHDYVTLIHTMLGGSAMHSLLEDYLSAVAAHLSALPSKQRAEELREMRMHLENAVIVSQELGQSEEEAAQNAVAQFGTPRLSGGKRLWRLATRRERSQARSVWGAAVCTLSHCSCCQIRPCQARPWIAPCGTILSFLQR